MNFCVRKTHTYPFSKPVYFGNRFQKTTVEVLLKNMRHNGRNHGRAMCFVSISRYGKEMGENELVNKIVKKETAASIFSDTIKSKLLPSRSRNEWKVQWAGQKRRGTKRSQYLTSM